MKACYNLYRDLAFGPARQVQRGSSSEQADLGRGIRRVPVLQDCYSNVKVL
jgi:hypothetical protein